MSITEAQTASPDAAFFSIDDPDGNVWLVQEVTTRLPGRVG